MLQAQIFMLSLVIFKVAMSGYLKCFVVGSDRVELYFFFEFFAGVKKAKLVFLK